MQLPPARRLPASRSRCRQVRLQLSHLPLQLQHLQLHLVHRLGKRTLDGVHPQGLLQCLGTVGRTIREGAAAVGGAGGQSSRGRG